MTELASYENKNVILCTYNNSCIPNRLVTVRITYKDKQKPWRIFVVQAQKLALPDMPDV